MNVRTCLIVSALIPFSAAAYSADQDSPPLLGPGGFEFSGKWTCDGSIPTGNGKTLAHHALYEGRTVSAGKWIELMQKDLQPPGYEADMLIGYDEHTKELVNFVLDNRGYAVLRSPGWQGRLLTLTMTGEGSYQGLPAEKPLPISRVTYEAKSANVFSLRWEVRKGSAWSLDDSLECIRPAGAG